MDTYHIAKLLQISGILVGTGLGTILLNPEVVGKLAHRINGIFLSLGDTVTKRYLTITKFIMPKGELVPAVTEAMSVSMVVLSTWGLLTIALQRNIVWIVWWCVSVLGFYAFSAIIDAIIRFFIDRPRRYPLWSFPILLAVKIVSGLVVFPIVVFILLILNYFVLLIVFLFNSVARKDIVRRWLIISGFALVLAGLTLEFFIAD